MRTQILLQRHPDGHLCRVCEADGRVVTRWLPREPVVGALDKGGFPGFEDARAFALGVDLICAERGLLSGLRATDIEHERTKLDRGRGRPSPEPEDPPLFEAA